MFFWFVYWFICTYRSCVYAFCERWVLLMRVVVLVCYVPCFSGVLFHCLIGGFSCFCCFFFIIYMFIWICKFIDLVFCIHTNINHICWLYVHKYIVLRYQYCQYSFMFYKLNFFIFFALMFVNYTYLGNIKYSIHSFWKATACSKFTNARV